MFLRDIPIRKKLRRVIILIWTLVLVTTCICFFAYELYVFNRSTEEKLSIIGRMIAANSTAALAFDDSEDATEILSALKAEPHIVQAALYDKNGKLFALFPADRPVNLLPANPSVRDYHYSGGYYSGATPIKQDKLWLGTFYLQYDIGQLYMRLAVFAAVVIVITAISFWLAVVLSKNLQYQITAPVLALADAARAISEEKNYTIRAQQYGNDEIGVLTDNFNQVVAEVEQFTYQMDKKVKERTQQLQQLNSELESFSYSVSHDLRAPLRAVSGYASMLQEDYGDKIDNEGKRYMTTIVQNAARMGMLIDDLLAFSRTGRKEVLMQMVDMQLLVNSCLSEIREQGGLDKYEFNIGDLTSCMGDHVLLKQVWMNLISNAIKYSGKNDNPVVNIAYSSSVEEHIYSIQDNGVGFDMKYAHKLFGVFQRLHSTQEFEGTGIGLALVQRIIHKHKGRTWVEAELNKGATFYFSIPKNIL